MSDRVVVSLPDRENEFQVLQAADAQSKAARLGLDIEVLHAENNAIVQIQQLFKFIHADSRPAAMIVEPVAADGGERVAQNAVTAGIGWGVLNCTVDYVEKLRLRHPDLAIFALGSDQVEIGRIQGRQIRALLPKGGTMLYVHGPRAATAAVERYRGTSEALAGANVETIVVDAQWSDESAEQAVRNWLRLRTSEGAHLDLVAGQDDAMARGARRAVESLPEAARRWAGIPYLGIDGVPTVGQKMVQSGQLAATVVMPSNTGPAIEAVAEWLRSRVPPPASIRVRAESYPSESELARRARR